MVIADLARMIAALVDLGHRFVWMGVLCAWSLSVMLGPADAQPADAQLETVPASLPGAPALPEGLRRELAEALAARGADYVPRTKRLDARGQPLYTNRLLLEKSPYLQQHAHNPVNWYPWGEEAFAAARRLGRPILVSIGYSTCHWCHVMEEESFDQLAPARYLNEHFVAIKVDREARPDVDAIYMSAIHAMGQSGGWPLNVWLTPAGNPFFGGTYFPPSDRAGRPGFLTMLERIHKTWEADAERVSEGAQNLAAILKRQLEGYSADATHAFDPALLDRATASYLQRVDRTWGGVGSGTKFPSSFPIRYLLSEYRRTGDPEIRSAVELTLEKMAHGGIRDQLGGGFHRYSTERRWLIPHFEIMLYDNAQLALAFVEASQVTGREDFAQVSREILNYLLREMQDPDGGFYSATDADSPNPEGEKEEGWFFTWTPTEMDAVLSPEQARIAKAYYAVNEAGDLDGRNILNRPRSISEVAAELELSQAGAESQLEAARKRLYAVRSKRPTPDLDRKVIVAWNGLAISALARAGFVLEEPRYVAAAGRAAAFVLDRMRAGGRLHRVSMDGEAVGPAFLEDYALLIAGLIDLYQADGNPRWIREAVALQKILDLHYLDSEGGGYFRTADDGELLIARQKPAEDGVIPSGNSVSAANLLRLGTLLGDDLYLERLIRLRSALHSLVEQHPTSAPYLLAGFADQYMGMREVVVVAPDDAADTGPMLAPLREVYGTNRVVAVTRAGSPLDQLARVVPPVSNRRALGGKVTAFVCENHVCQYPTSDPEVFRKQLESTIQRAAEN